MFNIHYKSDRPIRPLSQLYQLQLEPLHLPSQWMLQPKSVKSALLPALSWEAYSDSKPTRNKRRIMASPEARPKVSVQQRSVGSLSRPLANKGPKHLLLRTLWQQTKVTQMQILACLGPISLWNATLIDQLKYIPTTRIPMTP